MDDKKEKNTKKIKIKNKKEATKALSKKTGTSSTKKTTVKKKTSTNKIAVKKATQKKKPVNKVAIKKEENIILEKEEKKGKNTKKENNKTKVGTKPQKLKEPVNRKKIQKKEEKPKFVLPKEWQIINKNVKKEKEENTSTDKIKGKLRSSIFEEVDEKTFLIKKEKEKENIKKTLLIILIILVSIAVIVYLVFKYNDSLRKQLEKYEEFTIGTKVKLKDNSVWYVVEYSKVHDETVKLLKEGLIDINNDSKFDDKDKMKYNSLSESVYDEKNENSAAQYLTNTYKKELEKKVGTISEVSLLKSKEYVKIREKMGFGYEWSTGNWLASSSLGDWWVISSPMDDSVYAVTKTGTYKLAKANATNYVRPTIVIRKAFVEKMEEQNQDKDKIEPALYTKAKDIISKEIEKSKETDTKESQDAKKETQPVLGATPNLIKK